MSVFDIRYASAFQFYQSLVKRHVKRWKIVTRGGGGSEFC